MGQESESLGGGSSRDTIDDRAIPDEQQGPSEDLEAQDEAGHALKKVYTTPM